MKKTLLVIDMLEGFLREYFPLYCGKDAENIVPFVVGKISENTAADNPVIFIADNHDPDDEEFKMFPPHCVKGTKESEVLPELLQAAGEKYKLIPKTRYSGFFGTTLERELAEAAPEMVEVVGVCTNICVFFTVEGLRNRDYPTTVFREGVASFDKQAHEYALQQMGTVLGATIE